MRVGVWLFVIAKSCAKTQHTCLSSPRKRGPTPPPDVRSARMHVSRQRDMGPRFRGYDNSEADFSSTGAEPSVYQQLFEIIAPVLIIAGLGYGWARLGKPFDLATISGVVINI